MHRYKIRGVEIPLRKPLNGAAIQIQPNPLAQVFDAADVIRWITLLVESRLDLPIPPPAVVLLGCEHHRGVWIEAGKFIVAPMGG
jgi:hypothetical protein